MYKYSVEGLAPTDSEGRTIVAGDMFTRKSEAIAEAKELLAAGATEMHVYQMVNGEVQYQLDAVFSCYQ